MAKKADTERPLVVVPDEQPVAQFENAARGFGTRIAELRQAPLTRMTAELAGELIGDAKRYLGAVHEYFDPVVKDAFKTHRDATALRGKFLKPGEDADSIARDVARRCELKRLADIDAERRRLEEEARSKAEADRAATVQALADDGRGEEATVLAQAPIIAQAVHLDEDRGAPSTTTAIDKWRGAVKDNAKWLPFVAANPALWHIIETKQGALDRYIASTGGAIEIPGVEITKDVTIRRDDHATP